MFWKATFQVSCGLTWPVAHRTLSPSWEALWAALLQAIRGMRWLAQARRMEAPARLLDFDECRQAADVCCGPKEGTGLHMDRSC